MTPPPRLDIERLRQGAWRRGRPALDGIARTGFDAYVRSRPSVGGAFRLRDRCIRCIDGRVSGGVRLAGSGMLLGLEGALEFARLAGATGVTYHRDCGAARLWAERAGIDVADAPRHAREFAEHLADTMRVPCSEAKLEGTPGFHDELVVYYDGTGTLDPSGSPWLPKGFVVSRASLEPTYALEETELAISLALGPMGFGELFTPDTLLRVVAVGSDNTQLSDLHAEVGPLMPQFGGRAAADWLLAP